MTPIAASHSTIQHLEAIIKALGWTLQYVEYCENPRTPGLLGQIRGVTDRERKLVRVSTKANSTSAMLAENLAHELRHVIDPAWDCGTRGHFARS